MAKKYKGSRMVDYYEKYQLDKTASTKECKTILRRIHGDIRESMSNCSLNSEEIIGKLQDTGLICKSQSLSYIIAMNKWNLKLTTKK